MSLYEEISAARDILDIPEQATMETIKSNYRRLIAEWHPDTCDEKKELCEEMTLKIISAYRIIEKYCLGYQYSFSEETVKKYVSSEEWWFERFGDDPVWGGAGSKK